MDVCWTDGIWSNVKHVQGQTWDSEQECANYFGVSRHIVHARIYSTWAILSGPILSFINDIVYSPSNIIKDNLNARKVRQQNAGKDLSKYRRNIYENTYNILCVETGQVFQRVVDCLNTFGMSRSTLNGHINYPDKHPTAKGYHFKRIPKTNTDG